MRSFFARAAVRALGADAFADMVGGNLAGRSPRLGTRDLLKAYSTSPWIRATVNKCARDVASLTWTIEVPTRAGKAYRLKSAQRAVGRDRDRILGNLRAAGDLRAIPNHPALDTVAGGENPYFQGFSVIELTQIFLDLIGEGAWLLDKNAAGMPTTSYPIPSTWVSDLPTPARQTYVIDGPTGRREVGADDVIWFYHPDPFNPYARGTGTGLSLGDEIETDEYAAKHTKSWFKNRALPDVLVTGEFNDADKKSIETAWLNKLQGVLKAWTPFFLNRKVEVKALSQTFENMQLVDLRKSERDLIVQTYGVPPEIFGIVENSNRSTIDAADYLMKKYVTIPRAEFLRSVLQRTLVPMFDDRLVLSYVNPVAEDREFELKVLEKFPWAAKADEVRRRAGLDPLGGRAGGVHVLSFQDYVVDELTPTDTGVDPATPAPAPAPAAAAAWSRRRARKDGDATLSDADIERIVRSIETEAIAKRGKKVVASTVEAFGNEMLASIGAGVAFNLQDPKVVEYFDNWSAERITGINDTTREAVRRTMTEGSRDGETPQQLARRIADVFDAAEGPRSLLIARTEVCGASNFASWLALDQAGIETKEWLSTQDDRVRDTHQELDGQVVGINEEFESPAGGRALYPGGFDEPAEDCNCRCGVVAGLPADNQNASAARVARWKTLEADRRPYERQMRRAMRGGFAEQRAAAMAEFHDVVADSKGAAAARAS